MKWIKEMIEDSPKMVIMILLSVIVVMGLTFSQWYSGYKKEKALERYTPDQGWVELTEEDKERIRKENYTVEKEYKTTFKRKEKWDNVDENDNPIVEVFWIFHITGTDQDLILPDSEEFENTNLTKFKKYTVKLNKWDMVVEIEPIE